MGHTISADGHFQPTQERVEQIGKLVKPKTITALRRVLGTLNFYRRFVWNAVELLAPLNRLLVGHNRKNDRSVITWTPELEENFEKVKQAFVKYTLLHFPNNDSDITLTCDASQYTFGGVLEQIDRDGQRQPLGFFSGKFKENQREWSVFDKELHAIYAAVEHFEYMIEGRELTLFTDHKPLVKMFTMKKRSKLERRSRYIEYISQFTTKIHHISGVANIIADMLSCPEVDSVSILVNEDKIAAAQKDDVEIQDALKSGLRDHEIKAIRIRKELNMICSVFKGKNRPLIPKELRFPLFKQVHGHAHLGWKKMLITMRTRYFWTDMTKDIRNWCKTCLPCQKGKITRHTKSEIGTFPDTDRFEHVHIDLVVMKLSRNFRYVCSMIDRATGWLEAVPLENMTAETVVKAFYETWITRYGSPLKLTSDRGSQFISALFTELFELTGTDHIKTTSYHPQANGKIERALKVLKCALNCQGRDWVAALPSVLLGPRAAPVKDTEISCAELVFGRTLRLPGEFSSPSPEIQNTSQYVRQLREIFQKIRPVPEKHRSSKTVFIHKDLFKCNGVLLRIDKVKLRGQAPYEGPYQVIQRHKKYFKIEVKGKEENVSIDWLKPYYELIDDQVTAIQEEKSEKKPTLKKTSFETQVENTSKNVNLAEETVNNSLLNRKRNPSFIIYVLPETPCDHPNSPTQTPGSVGGIPKAKVTFEQGPRRSGREKRKPARYGYW